MKKEKGMRILPTVKIKQTYIMRLAILLLFFLGGLQQNYAVDLGELLHESSVEKSAVGYDNVKAWDGLFPSETLRKNIDALTEGDYLLGKGFTKSDLNGFATYVDNAFSGTKSTLTSRINSGNGFNLIHTDEQIQVIMLRAKSLNLPADEIDDLLLVSCRSSKPIPAADLMQQMDNWVNVVKARGYPYRFSSLSEFQQFGGSLKNKLGDVNVGTGDVRVQGSSLRTPDANDVDLAAIISQSEFDNFMKSGYSNRVKKNGNPVDMSNMTHQDLVNLSNDITQNPSLYNGVARNDFNYNFPNKIIKATPDKGVIPGLRDKLTEIQSEFPGLNVENITIQETGSAFDLKPFLNL